MTSAGADQRAYQMTMSKGDSALQGHAAPSALRRRRHRAQDQPASRGHPQPERREDPVVSRLRVTRPAANGAGARTCHRQAHPQAVRSRAARSSRAGCCTSFPTVRTPYGDAYAELYLAQPTEPCQVALTRSGTRVVENLASLPGLDRRAVVVALPAGADRRTVPESDAGNPEAASSMTSATPPFSRRSSRLRRSLNALIEAQQKAEDEQAEPAIAARHPAGVPGSAAGPAARGVRLVRRPGTLQKRTEWRRQPRSISAQATRRPKTRSPASAGRRAHLHRRRPTPILRLRRPALWRRRLADGQYGVVNERRRFRVLPRDRSRRRVTEEPGIRVGDRRRRGINRQHGRSGSRSSRATAMPGLVRLRVIVTQARGRVLRRGSGDGHRQPRRLCQLGCRQLPVACPATRSSGPPASSGAPDSIPSAMSSSSIAGTATSFSRPRPGSSSCDTWCGSTSRSWYSRTLPGCRQSSYSSAWLSFLSTQRKNSRQPIDGRRSPNSARRPRTRLMHRFVAGSKSDASGKSRTRRHTDRKAAVLEGRLVAVQRVHERPLLGAPKG